MREIQGLAPQLPERKKRPSSNEEAGRPTWADMPTTIGHLLDAYVAHAEHLFTIGQRREPTIRSMRSLARLCFDDLRPLAPEDLTPRLLRAWHLKIAGETAQRPKARGGTATANCALKLLGQVLREAEGDGVIPRGSSPARYVRRFQESSRSRYLDAGELASIWRALGAVAVDRRRARRALTPVEAIRLLMLTGMRHREVLSLRVEHVDLARAVLRLPITKTTAREVPLSAEAVAVVRRQLAHARDGWVFPGHRTGYWQDLRPVWALVLDVAGVDRRGVVIHTLRHSLATLSLVRGHDLRAVARVLGHRDTQITESIYGRPLATPDARAVVADHGAAVRAA